MSKKMMPYACPSCQNALKAVRLTCGACGTAVEGGFDLPVLARLDAEDQLFLLSFLKSSGSLKEMARQQGVSYPTVRNRLDALIGKVAALEAGKVLDRRES
jgi:hypothetical protein